MLLRSEIRKFLIKNSEVALVERKADTGNYVWCGVRENYKIRKKSVRVIGRKKRKTVRDSGVINGAVTQDAVCKDRWVKK